jgi:regulator of sigma E protease
MYVMAMISINLGIINLFPIPALDGFHIFMYAFEGITRKEIKPKIKEILTIVGFSLLILLMIYAFFNDITHYIPLMFGK